MRKPPSSILAGTDGYVTRLLHVLIAALCKVGARHVDLAPRSCLCIAKVTSHRRWFHASVAQRANEALRTVKFAAVAAHLLARPARFFLKKTVKPVSASVGCAGGGSSFLTRQACFGVLRAGRGKGR